MAIEISPEEYIFYLTSVVLVFLLGILGRILWFWTRLPDLRVVIRGIFWMVSGLITASIFIIIGQFDDMSFVENVLEEIIYAAGYFLYYALWLYGINYFVNNVVKIPEERKSFLGRVNVLINFQIIVSLLFAIFVLVVSETQPVQGNDDYFDLIEASFAILSQIAILMFVYFLRNLRREQHINLSKLAQARIELIKYTIYNQIFLSISILIVSIYLVFGSRSQEQDTIAEAILFTIFNITNIVSSFLLVLSIRIPSYVRERYNITSGRFEAIRRLQTMGDDNEN